MYKHIESRSNTTIADNKNKPIYTHIVGLEIPMNDALLMGGAETREYLSGHVPHLLDWQLAVSCQ